MKKVLFFITMLIICPIAASATTITFSEFTSGTVISGQYSDPIAEKGVEFFPGLPTPFGIQNFPIITGTTNQVLSPNPLSFYIVFIHGATNVSFDSGYWNESGSGIITFSDRNGIKLGEKTNLGTGNYHFDFGGVEIGTIMFNSSLDTGGASIDNLKFDQSAPVPEPSTMLLLGSGLAGLIGYGRRRMKK
jgi:hypothetical protein